MLKYLAIGLMAASSAAACATTAGDSAPTNPGWAVAIHGGAGVIRRESMDAETEAAYRASMTAALDAAVGVLEEGGSSLDAVEAAIRLLEDDDKFNAGKGAVFTAAGKNELDASIMDGRGRGAGAVAGVTRVKHPITLARAVMEKSPHVMFAREGAEAFAEEVGVELVDPSYFYTQRRWDSLQRALEAAPKGPDKYGTVGVVARDATGRLAAGTSTGGMTAKLYGRVGDSPLIGAGTYADDASCAVSATGHGEYFIRVGVAKSICDRVAFLGEDLRTAADAVLAEVAELGGDGGVIVVGPDGDATWSFNTAGMYRARQREGGVAEIAVFGEDAAG